MSENSLISIIVPIYRVDRYLRQCIESIQKQTYKSLQIILVDDGSDDDCPQICDSYAKQDSRITVIHKENGGQDSARKAAMEAVRGEYVGYVDGDDWIELNYYETMLHYAKLYDAKVVLSGVIDETGRNGCSRIPFFKEGYFNNELFEKEIEPYILFNGNFYEYGVEPYLWNKLFEVSYIREFQMMDGNWDGVADGAMVALPAVVKSKSLYICHKCLYHYRVRQGSSKRVERKNTSNVIRENYNEWINRFSSATKVSKIEYQINSFCVYQLAYNNPEYFDDLHDENVLKLYGGIDRNSTIVLWGAGVAGIHVKNYLDRYCKEIKIIWVDTNYEYFPKEMEVANPKIISDVRYDYVVISVIRYKVVQNILQCLAKMNVAEEKIRWLDRTIIDYPEKVINQLM